MMKPLLDNPFWHALTTTQSRFACGRGDARRFTSGFSPILAFKNPRQPSFADLAGDCSVGERFYCDAWPGDAPAGWEIEHEAPTSLMVWEGIAPVPGASASALVRLDAGSVHRMLELADITHPGPFGPRTPELGEYWGIQDGERLVAMAGERLQLRGLREISGVCTLPEYRGRGYARELVGLLVRRQLARGETPFLHVLRTNVTARCLYARMGFVEARAGAVRILVKR